jgi:CheY-like chemotaxis protein
MGVCALGNGQMTCIVVVEDEIQVLMLAELVLQQAGYDTESAGSVAEAQAIIQTKAKFDLVFTDIQLGNHEEGGLTGRAGDAGSLYQRTPGY